MSHDTRRSSSNHMIWDDPRGYIADQALPHSGVAPCLLLAGYNAYTLWNEHWEHWSHMPPLEERVEYPYQNIRTRNFPWGDGDKV